MILCPCGHEFPEELGRYGCPNCEGTLANDSTADRQARSRKARAEAGGKQIAVMLTPEAAKRLEALRQAGETIAGAINRLLLAAR